MVNKIITLLSPGIDSPVAAHLLVEAGADVVLLNFLHRPRSESNTEIVKDIVDKLKGHHTNIKAYSAPFHKIQKAFTDKIDNRYRCILCRRMMYRAGEKLTELLEADSLATGESLGQVASQTLSNISSEDSAVGIEIHRPLIGLDKDEIISIAKEIGTYSISIRESISCGFNPVGPKVRTTLEKVLEQEKKLDIKDLIDEINFTPI